MVMVPNLKLRTTMQRKYADFRRVLSDHTALCILLKAEEGYEPTSGYYCSAFSTVFISHHGMLDGERKW
jgi:hypothetical protein